MKEFFHGFVRTLEKKEGTQFLRFTEKQEENYRNPAFFHYDGCRFHEKTFASSGIMLEMDTDASEAELLCSVASGSSRTFYDFDVLVDGVLCGHAGSDDYRNAPEARIVVPMDGKKHRLQILFPCLAAVTVRSLNLKNASLAEPVRKKGSLLAFGDSITQGYDQRHPYFNYPNWLGLSRNLQVFNKAIGGDRFRPSLLMEKDPFEPALITVAYGTNDWQSGTRAVLERDANVFFRRLAELYPSVPVVAILPVWRGNGTEKHDAGTLTEASGLLREICRKYPNVRVVDGMKLIPHCPDFFSPDQLHPNDMGGCCFSMGLEKETAGLILPTRAGE